LTACSRIFTERVEAEARLRRSEERFQAFMDNSPAVAFMKDEAGRLVYVNRVFENRFQSKAAEVLGKLDAELWEPHVASQFRDSDEKVHKANRPMEFLERVPTPDGAVRDWWVLKFPIPDALGRKCWAVWRWT